MCGVFGFVSSDDRPVDLFTLRRIAVITMRRGPHAWGLAWVDSKGKIKSYKQTGRIVDSLGLLSMARDAKMIIGHCRFATHGDPADNLNNHPHDGGDAWVVHNGQIKHYKTLIDMYGLEPYTECDSEVLGLMLQKFDGEPFDKVRRITTEASGFTPFSMMALWKNRLIMSKANGQPLHEGETRHGWYLASLREGLPGFVSPIEDHEVIEYCSQ
tara:strand:- start:4970 stop:5608 length:639 start_codon:yes stop_codon:yes gene_type:complete